MSEDLIPVTPKSLPTFINEKLDALGLDTKEADLNVIRELLSVHQEDRVLSQKEVCEWRESERKILVNLRNYKNDSKNIVKKGKCSLWFCMFFTLPISFCIYEAAYLENYFYFKLFFRWPIHFIAILIHFYHLSIVSTHRIIEPVQVLGIVNDDWQYSMTSAELHSRQKALVNEWTQIVKNRVKDPSMVVPRIAQLINCLYFVFRYIAVWIIFSEGKFAYILGPSAFLRFVGLCFSVFFMALFSCQVEVFPKRKTKDGVAYRYFETIP